MDGFSLRCNNLVCRCYLKKRAVVTTCSHVFCVGCAEELLLINPPPGHPRQCIACDGLLPAPDDAIISDLDPSDDYKASLLNGLSPSVIMEICGKGLAFWSYQVTQEVAYQEHITKSLTERYSAQSNEFDKFVGEAGAEVLRLKGKITTLSAEEEDLKRKNHELLEGWREKGHKLAQTQELYDKLKRRTLISQVGQRATENVEHLLGHNGLPTYDRAEPSMLSMQSNNPPAMRGHKNPGSQDFMMIGARIGSINGGRRSEGGGSSGGMSPTLRTAHDHGVYHGAGMSSNIFRQESAPSMVQEHRHRLPPTPANPARTSLYGQHNRNMASHGERNPLSAMHANFGGHVYGKR